MKKFLIISGVVLGSILTLSSCIDINKGFLPDIVTEEPTVEPAPGETETPTDTPSNPSMIGDIINIKLDDILKLNDEYFISLVSKKANVLPSAVEILNKDWRSKIDENTPEVTIKLKADNGRELKFYTYIVDIKGLRNDIVLNISGDDILKITTMEDYNDEKLVELLNKSYKLFNDSNKRVDAKFTLLTKSIKYDEVGDIEIEILGTASYNFSVKKTIILSISNEWPVTFLDYNGKPITTIFVEDKGKCVFDGEIPMKPETPDYTYRFIGWDQKLDEITSALVVRPVYETINKFYAITMHNEGNIEGVKKIAKGSEIGELLAPATKPGYAFMGWYLESDYQTKIDESFIPNKDINIFAKWVREEVSFNFYWDNELLATKIYKHDNLLSAKNYDPGVVNYKFEGWYLDKEFTRLYVGELDDSVGEVNLYGKFESLEMTITFMSKDESYTINNPYSMPVTKRSRTLNHSIKINEENFNKLGVDFPSYNDESFVLENWYLNGKVVKSSADFSFMSGKTITIVGKVLPITERYEARILPNFLYIKCYNSEFGGFMYYALPVAEFIGTKYNYKKVSETHSESDGKFEDDSGTLSKQAMDNPAALSFLTGVKWYKLTKEQYDTRSFDIDAVPREKIPLYKKSIFLIGHHTTLYEKKVAENKGFGAKANGKLMNGTLYNLDRTLLIDYYYGVQAVEYFTSDLSNSGVIHGASINADAIYFMASVEHGLTFDPDMLYTTTYAKIHS